jgi:hypothetical protein
VLLRINARVFLHKHHARGLSPAAGRPALRGPRVKPRLHGCGPRRGIGFSFSSELSNGFII